MTNLEYDLRYVGAAGEILKDYLLSKDIYRPIGIIADPGEPPYPQLTLGNMLLALQRAQAKTTTTQQRSNLHDLKDRVDIIHQDWRVAWENKAREEFRARLRLWGNYLDDFRKDPELHASRYSYEVGRRVLLEILHVEARQVPSEQEALLDGMDKLVHAFFIHDRFIWEPELISQFPEKTYWYLYGYLPSKLLSTF